MLRIAEERATVAERLVQLVEELGCRGKHIHDANVVATMSAHGLDVWVTGNMAHFRRFVPIVTVLEFDG